LQKLPGSFAGGFLPKDFGSQLIGRSLIGGITGGITAEIAGAEFWEGFAQGAFTSAAGFLFNSYIHGELTSFSEFQDSLSSYGLGGLPKWLQAILYPIFEDPSSSMVGGIVTFGHGARHLAGTGLSRKAVESALRVEVNAIKSKASSIGSFWGRIGIGGKTIEYRAFTLPDGSIHIGTYYPLK